MWVDVILVLVEDVGNIVVSGDICINDVVSVYFGFVDIISVVCLDGMLVIGVGVIC